jgi:soluble lytic murein transglycosylase-like protein
LYRWRGRGLGALSISDLINSAAAKYSVPPAIALAVAEKESGFNQAAVGISGEIGVFQLMPGTAAGLGVDPSNLSQNVDGGVRYLSQLYAQFGDWWTALVAYNGGPGNVTAGTVSTAAQGYATSVLNAADLSSLILNPVGPALPDGTSAPVDETAVSGVSLSSPLVWGLGLAVAGLLVVWIAD